MNFAPKQKAIQKLNDFYEKTIIIRRKVALMVALKAKSNHQHIQILKNLTALVLSPVHVSGFL